MGRFLYTPAAIIPFIYDKVYASDGDTLFAYIYPLGVVCRGVCNVTAWVGYIFFGTQSGSDGGQQIGSTPRFCGDISWEQEDV